MRTSHELPSLDNILTSSFTGGPSPLGKVSPSRPKPPLARRAVSHGHRRHKSRGVIGGGIGGFRDRLGSGDLDQVFAGGNDRYSDTDIPTAAVEKVRGKVYPRHLQLEGQAYKGASRHLGFIVE
ncbi:hypothetical protein QTG54_012446 [Skeletonema marinoi]|uniref:Uncharacterized protein n=1 Tax=Skeletonema marinoi TaxID=267567 RepID=A0AAD8XZX0_9STRA|nr:hypothetical protein QTG54_012446 [Skeletonema marinoi]